MVQFRFFSRRKKFFEMFSEAARNVHQGAKALEQMLHDFQGSPDQWRAVEEYEHEGDKITHRIMQTLHQSSMTPGDREDIHKLAATLDDVLDLVEGAAFRMAMYKVVKPTPEALRLAALIVRCTEQIVSGVSALPDSTVSNRTASRSTDSRTRRTRSPEPQSRDCSPRSRRRSR